MYYETFQHMLALPMLFSINALRWNCGMGIGLCSVLRPCQHSTGYTGDDFYRSKDPTNSI